VNKLGEAMRKARLGQACMFCGTPVLRGGKILGAGIAHRACELRAARETPDPPKWFAERLRRCGL
jgi:hypothetical protein